MPQNASTDTLDKKIKRKERLVEELRKNLVRRKRPSKSDSNEENKAKDFE